MNLVAQQAASVQQPMPLGKLLKTQLDQLVNDKKGQLDWSAISTVAATQ